MSKTNNAAVSESDTMENKTANVAPADNREAGFVYIGPSLPGDTRLMPNTIIRGTREKVREYYKDVFEKFPNAERLIVPVERLAESREKIRAGGNVLNKYYNDLMNQVQKGAVE